VEPLGGKLLISNASLFDPNFRRTVVLIGHHDDEGAVGVILNRPTEVAVDEAVPALAHLVTPGDLLFEGGPVQPDAAVVVAEFGDPAEAGLVAFGSIGFLPDEAEPEDLDGVRRARVFAGYAGWGAGQLEQELDEDAWLIVPAEASDVFHEEPERLWEDVLRRLGPAFAMMRTMPADPSLNGWRGRRGSTAPPRTTTRRAVARPKGWRTRPPSWRPSSATADPCWRSGWGPGSWRCRSPRWGYR
jgi:putative transcriptional regulator